MTWPTRTSPFDSRSQYVYATRPGDRRSIALITFKVAGADASNAAFMFSGFRSWHRRKAALERIPLPSSPPHDVNVVNWEMNRPCTSAARPRWAISVNWPNQRRTSSPRLTERNRDALPMMAAISSKIPHSIPSFPGRSLYLAIPTRPDAGSS